MKRKKILNSPKRVLKKRIPTLLSLLFLTVLFGVIMGMSGTIKAEKKRLTAEKMGAAATERAPVNVVLLNVTPTTIQDRINLPGVIEPWEKLRVLAKIHGTVMKVEVSEGEAVSKGQVIARLDPAHLDQGIPGCQRCARQRRRRLE